MSAVVLTLPVALFLAAVHVLSARLTHLDPVPRSAWLSFGGGVSVAYVFMHVIPELAAHEDKLRDQGSALAAETQVFAMALAGLVAFYGLERMARVSSRGEARGGGAAVFWVHIGSFALYNGLIGYLLLHREEMDVKGLILFTVALGLHFVVNDRGLASHHGRLYARYGRWIVAGAVLAGWTLGILLEPRAGVIASSFAFLAGGIVLKEELPDERESRFSAFVVGAVGYAALLTFVA